MVRCPISLAIAALAVSSGIPSAAHAGVKSFTGTRMNVDSPGPAAERCGARTTANIRPSATSTSVGMSNLGAFVPILSHCIQLPLAAVTPFDLGEFSFDFGGGDTLFGSYAGTVTFAAAGLFNIAQSHVVTGGTGKFADATGGFDSAGTLSFLNGPPTVEQAFSGTISAPGIPEPATWALMIGGFGMAGAALRRRAPEVTALA